MTTRHLRLVLAGLLAAAGLLSSAPPARAVTGATQAAMVLASSPNPSQIGEEVTLTATVSGWQGTPTGSVTFSDGGAPLGSASLDGTGTATITTTFDSAGAHMLSAEYAGDVTYAPVSSVPRTHTTETTVSRKTWVGGAGALWSTAANWSPASVPANGDTVVFGNVTSPTTADIANLTLAHLSITGGGTINAGSGVTLGLTGDILGDVAIDATVFPPIALASGTHTIDGRVGLRGVVSGAGGLKKTGPGASGMAGANTYAGTTEVASGSLGVPNGTGLGAASAGTTVAAGAALAIGGGGAAVTVAEPLTLAGDGVPDPSRLGALHATGGWDVILTGPLALAGDRVTIGSSSQLALRGVVSGPSQLRTSGAGTVVLEGANTFAGGVDIVSGTTSVKAASGLGTGTVSVGNHAKLHLPTALTIANAVTTSNLAEISVGAMAASTAARLTGPVTLGGETTFSGPATGALRLSGVLSGPGSVIKASEALVFFDGPAANTYTGLTSVNRGVLLSAKGAPVAGVPGDLSVMGAFAADNDDQIGNTASVSVAFGGTFALRGWFDVIGSYSSAGVTELGVDEPEDTYFGVLTTNSLTLSSGGYFIARVAGDEPGWSHDRFNVNGPVSLGGNLQVKGRVPPGKTVKLIDKRSAGPVSGRFDPYPEGASVPMEGGGSAVLSYKGGDGNDVTLTVPARSGYWMMGAEGKVYPFGDAKFYGDLSSFRLNAAVVDIEPTSESDGYWILTSAGHVFAFGSAPFFGSAEGGLLEPGEVATSISNDGYDSYWIFTSKGRALEFGDAGHYGDMEGVPLNGPVRGSVATPTGEGYYMVASDGGIFSFGDARFRGSMGGQRLNGPVVGMAPDPDNTGYWQVASDGGIFAFDAGFRGSMGGQPLNRPVVGMVAYGDGYLMVASDGGIFNFSTKPFRGSLGANPPATPIIAVAPLND